MQLIALAVVESWHIAINTHDIELACALASDNVEIVGPRGSSRGLAGLREWLGRVPFSAEPLRWFCGRSGCVVVEQLGYWMILQAATERIVASSFCVVNGRVVRLQRFGNLDQALRAASLSDEDEVLG